jgi:hypothetical protein
MCRKFTTLLHDSDMSEDEIGELRDELKAYKEQLDAMREDLKLVIKYSDSMRNQISSIAGQDEQFGPDVQRCRAFCNKYKLLIR